MRNFFIVLATPLSYFITIPQLVGSIHSLVHKHVCKVLFFLFIGMELSTTLFASIVCAYLICNAVGQSYVEDDRDTDLPAPVDLDDPCSWCDDYPDSEACQLCLANEQSQTPQILYKRSGPFYRSIRSSCSCCLLSRRTNYVCCEACNSLNGGIYKRAQSPAIYNPLLRGGYQKKSQVYNPLLRGGYQNKRQVYNPLLRGGFIKRPSGLQSRGFYNPILRGGFQSMSADDEVL